jgi:hypothetical protein
MTDKPWRPYKGKYEKEFYDIELDSGAVIRSCWPNANTFHDTEQRQFAGFRVKRFRLCMHPMMAEQGAS